MKKLMTVCTLVALLMGLAVMAAPQKAVEPLTTMSAASDPGLAVKLEIQSLTAEISAAKAAGQMPNPALMARLNELLPPVRSGGTLDQGGETIETAVAIAALPYTDTGSTVGAVHDYDEVCDYTGSLSNDVVYSYLCPASEVVDIDLCASGYDTKVYVYENVYTPGFPYACNDDYCPGYRSFIGNLNLTGGNTYYIVVDGFGSANGDYSMTISGSPPLAPGDVCASAIVIPGFPYSITGQSTNGYADDYTPECLGVYGTGWDVVYTFTLTATTTIRIDLTNTGDYAYAGIGLFNGCPDVGLCVAFDYYYTGDLQIPCTTLEPGVYFILLDNWPSPDYYPYDLAVDVCVPCDPPVNDNCVDALPIAVNGESVCATTECSTLDCETNDFAEIWYTFTTTECMDITLAYCGTTTSGNLLAVLYSGSCCGTPWYYSSYEYLSCPDGLISLQFNALPAGQYWLPIGFLPAGPFCVQVLGEACPPPFECHCLDPMDGRWCNTVGGPINDVSANSFPIEVPIQYHITDVNVCFDLTHTYDGDLNITLESPLGTIIALSTNRGGGGDNFVCTIFDDEATTPIASGVAPFSGSFIPDGALSGFDNENAAGTWILHIDDLYGGDFGILNWACLTFEWDIILAVELSGFDAIAGDNSVMLNWTTGSETNNDRFEIVRDGAVVGQVPATNNASGSEYSWMDRNVVNGTTYTYTLVSVDMNGSREELETESATPNAGAAVITEYALHQNYPNPFNPETSIAYDLVESGFVSLTVYNMIGQQVATLVNSEMSAGRHIVAFDASDLPSGLYLYRIEANGFSAQMKMMLLK